MKSYNLVGYAVIFLNVLAAGYFAPPGWGFLLGATVGLSYLLLLWFIGGVYASNVLHLGIAHKAFCFKDWFVKFITVFYSMVGIYVDPTGWVNRHRHHHAFSDHEGDPNKTVEDGFWKTLYLCFSPYECKTDMAKDEILKTPTMRVVSTPYFAIFSQFSSYGVLWFAFGEWIFALALWIGVRLFALWVNMIQNFWAHDRRYGTQPYEADEDNSVNIHDWFTITATFSECLQNNHHHAQGFLRTSHTESEYDFGLKTARLLKAIGLVKPSLSGIKLPKDIPLREVGF